MPIPEDPLEFYSHPILILTFCIAAVLIVMAISLVKFSKVRRKIKPLFKIYCAIALGPVYFFAGVIYVVTLSKLNLFQKFIDINFSEKFKNIYTEPTRTFEEMRVNPQKYHIWVAIFICVVYAFIIAFFTVFVSQKFYGGQESIIFGLLSSESPTVLDPYRRWIMLAITGIFVWIPTKFTIHFLAITFHKYDKTGEPTDRPWYDKVRLIYISWGYIIAADSVWALGLFISLLLPIWEGLIFAWTFVIICGLIELFLQFYSLRGLYKMGWLKSIVIWALSMIPAALTMFLLQFWLGPLIVNLIP